MHKFWLLFLIPVLIFSGFGCVSDSSAPATDSLLSTIKATQDTVKKHTEVIDALRVDVDKKATKTEIDDLNRKINNLPQSGSATPTDVYTKEQVNQAIADAITALKNEKPWAGSTGVPGTSDTGTVVFTNNPAAIPQIFSSSSGGNSNPWIMTIKNNSTTWQYVKPMVSLNVASGQPSSIVNDVSLMASGGNCSLTGTFLVPGNYTFSPSNMNTVATPSVIIFPISGCNGSGEWYIGPGQQQAYNIQIQGLKTPNPILWNVSCSISSRSM